jgi:hypothetical protein
MCEIRLPVLFVLACRDRTVCVCAPLRRTICAIRTIFLPKAFLPKAQTFAQTFARSGKNNKGSRALLFFFERRRPSFLFSL